MKSAKDSLSNSTPPAQSTEQLIKWFIVSSHTVGSFNEDHVKNAISLLYRVPSSRYAVLEWFTQIFEECVRRIISEYSNDNMSSAIHHSLELIESTLTDLLTRNRSAWSTLLCEWSVQALGQISSTYKSRTGMMPSSNAQYNSQLYSMVEFWMNIYPTRKLMEIYKTCLKCLIDQNADSCMDSLLATCAKHSPHFDWVVADIGDNFPSEIINRILMVGYKNYSQQQWGNETMEDMDSNLKSVVKILEHLATKHRNGVKNAMVSLFKAPSTDTCGKIKTVLYILQLISDSPLLIKVSTTSFVSQIDDSVMNTLYKQYTKLSNHRNSFDQLCSLIVHVVCQSSDGSFQLIEMLMKAADKKDTSSQFANLDKQAKKVCSKIMSSLVNDLKRMLIRKSSSTVQDKEFGLTTQLKAFNKELCNEILASPSEQKKKWLHTLLVIVCIQDYSHVVFSQLLMQVKSDDSLRTFINLHNDVSSIVPEIIKISVEYSFMMLENNETNSEQKTTLFNNLHRLLTATIELPNTETLQSKLHKSLTRHVNTFLNEASSPSSNDEIARISSSILLQLITFAPMKLQTKTFSLIQGVVLYFFRLLHQRKVNNDHEMMTCRKVLVNLAETLDHFTLVCQSLLDDAGKVTNAKLFGRPMEEDFDINESVDSFFAEQNVSLFAQHRKATKSAAVAYFSNIAETGIIGSGPKKRRLCPLSKEDQNSNNDCLALTIYRCACKTGSSGSMEGGTIHDTPGSFDSTKLVSLSVKLIDMILSHIPASLLHSDMEWPHPSFRQYTIERDLNFLKFTEEHAFVLKILHLVANEPSALWNCSVVLRGLLGALMHSWSSSRQHSSASSSNNLKLSIDIIEILGKGQIIPPPLSFVSELFHLISPYEIFIILCNIWMFIHEHPLPTDESNKSSQEQKDNHFEGVNITPYLTPIQSIIHSNISSIGHLFSRYIINKHYHELRM